MNNLCKLKEKKLQKNLVIKKKCSTFVPGEMAEWSIAAVLKTVELRGSGGSNPSLSAENNKAEQTTDVVCFVFCDNV